MSTYYRTCGWCGANLDPGEPCDCNFGQADTAPEEDHPDED